MEVQNTIGNILAAKVVCMNALLCKPTKSEVGSVIIYLDKNTAGVSCIPITDRTSIIHPKVWLHTFSHCSCLYNADNDWKMNCAAGLRCLKSSQSLQQSWKSTGLVCEEKTDAGSAPHIQCKTVNLLALDAQATLDLATPFAGRVWLLQAIHLTHKEYLGVCTHLCV